MLFATNGAFRMPNALRVRATDVLSFLLIALVVFVAASLLDRWSYERLVYAGVYERDWGRMVRIYGYLPLWAMLASALVLHDRSALVAAPWRRGGLLLGAATLGGVTAEVLKLLLRRERPRLSGGSYEFRDFSQEPFSTGGLGLPSGHTVVAFAGAAMLAKLFPRAAPVWYLFAVACAVTRMLTQAHFLSDVVLAAFVGLAVSGVLWRWAAGASPRRTEAPAHGA